MLDPKKKEYIKRLFLEVNWGDRKVARVFDCDPKFVKRIRREMIESGEISQRKIADDLADDS